MSGAKIRCGQHYADAATGETYVLDAVDGDTHYLAGRLGREVAVSEAQLRRDYTTGLIVHATRADQIAAQWCDCGCRACVIGRSVTAQIAAQSEREDREERAAMREDREVNATRERSR